MDELDIILGDLDGDSVEQPSVEENVSPELELALESFANGKSSRERAEAFKLLIQLSK